MPVQERDQEGNAAGTGRGFLAPDQGSEQRIRGAILPEVRQRAFRERNQVRELARVRQPGGFDLVQQAQLVREAFPGPPGQPKHVGQRHDDRGPIDGEAAGVHDGKGLPKQRHRRVRVAEGVGTLRFGFEAKGAQGGIGGPLNPTKSRPGLGEFDRNGVHHIGGPERRRPHATGRGVLGVLPGFPGDGPRSGPHGQVRLGVARLEEGSRQVEQHLGHQPRLSSELLDQDLLRQRDPLGERQRLPIRPAVVSREHRLELRERRGPTRAGDRQVSLLGGAPGLRHREGGGPDQDRRDQRRRGHADPIPANELPDPIPQRVRPGTHRLVLEEAPEIVGQRGDRLIPFPRLLPKRLEEDRVEVTQAKSLRFRLEHRPNALGRRGARAAGRVPPRHEEIEQHAEGIHVRGGGDRVTLDLFGRGVVRGQRAPGFSRERGPLVLAIALEQLGDAEVEQLDLALGGDQDVRRLEIAMDDQVGVRMGHRVEHLEDQPKPVVAGELGRLGVFVDSLAVDVLEDQIRLPRGSHAGIEEPGNGGMGQPRQCRPLAPEPLLARLAHQRQAHELHRRLSLVSSVSPATEPD